MYICINMYSMYTTLVICTLPSTLNTASSPGPRGYLRQRAAQPSGPSYVCAMDNDLYACSCFLSI